jgi:hypothetical protein
MMSKAQVLAALIAGLAVAAPPAAHALFSRHQDQPWCAAFNDSIRDCGYLTIAQCRAAISGVGGLCELNPFYRGSAAQLRRYDRRRQPR